MVIWLCACKLLQLSLSPPQIHDLLLQLLQSFFSSTHWSSFLSSDQLCHLRAASLNGVNEIREDLLTVLHCCLCRPLLGHTSQSERMLQHLNKLNLKLLLQLSAMVLLQTHLKRLYNPSHFLKLIFSLLDPLLECSLHLPQFTLYTDKQNDVRNFGVYVFFLLALTHYGTSVIILLNPAFNPR